MQHLGKRISEKRDKLQPFIQSIQVLGEGRVRTRVSHRSFPSCSRPRHVSTRSAELTAQTLRACARSLAPLPAARRPPLAAQPSCAPTRWEC
jgi:hypothetical protein